MTKCQKCKMNEATSFFRILRVCPECYSELYSEIVKPEKFEKAREKKKLKQEVNHNG